MWLALAFSDHLHHGKAVTWFGEHLEVSCAFCRITQLALLRHLTNPKIMGVFVQSQENAWMQYDRFTDDSRVIFLGEPPALEAAFRSLAKAGSPSHELWTDAYLASFAIQNHALFVTFDKGFSRFPGLDLMVL